MREILNSLMNTFVAIQLDLALGTGPPTQSNENLKLAQIVIIIAFSLILV